MYAGLCSHCPHTEFNYLKLNLQGCLDHFYVSFVKYNETKLCDSRIILCTTQPRTVCGNYDRSFICLHLSWVNLKLVGMRQLARTCTYASLYLKLTPPNWTITSHRPNFLSSSNISFQIGSITSMFVLINAIRGYCHNYRTFQMHPTLLINNHNQ